MPRCAMSGDPGIRERLGHRKLTSRSAVNPRLIALTAALATMLWSCSGSEPASNPAGTTSTPTSTTSLPATTTTLAPEEAHVFEGEWLLTYTLETVSEDFSAGLDPGDRDIRLVEVSSQCDVGPCDLDMNFRTPYLDQDPIPGIGEWTGSQYELVDQIPGLGRCTGSQGTVFEDGFDLTTTITIEATGFEISERGWLVSEVAGRRVLEWVPTEEAADGGCGTFTEEYSVTGLPFHPDLFSLPQSDPLPAGAIVYREATADLRGLVVSGPDGAILQVPDIPLQYAVSPDGRSVAYVDGSGLWLASADGGEVVELFPDDRVAPFSELAWSADGSRVAFVRSNIDEGADVWYVRVPFGVPERVTSGGGALGGVAWRPDDTILFDWGVNEEDKSTDPATTALGAVIYGFDVETEQTAEVVSSGFRPRVGGDGTALSYLVPDLDDLGRPFRWSIRVSDVDGSGGRSVVTASLGGGCAFQQSVHAVGLPCSSPVSPDGSAVIFSISAGCDGCDPALFGFDSFGVWKWNVTTGERTLVAEEGANPQWVNVPGGGGDE